MTEAIPKVGALDTLVTIQTRTVTTNASGGETTTWTTYASDRWANITYTPESREVQTDSEMLQVVATRRMLVTIRHDPSLTITETMRVVVDGAPCDILAIRKVGRQHFISLEVEKRDNVT